MLLHRVKEIIRLNALLLRLFRINLLRCKYVLILFCEPSDKIDCFFILLEQENDSETRTQRKEKKRINLKYLLTTLKSVGV